jgi:hypothetical protein
MTDMEGMRDWHRAGGELGGSSDVGTGRCSCSGPCGRSAWKYADSSTEAVDDCDLERPHFTAPSSTVVGVVVVVFIVLVGEYAWLLELL